MGLEPSLADAVNVAIGVSGEFDAEFADQPPDNGSA